MTISPVTSLIVLGSWALAVVKRVLTPYVRWQLIENLIYSLQIPHCSPHMHVTCGEHHLPWQPMESCPEEARLGWGMTQQEPQM